MKEGIRILLVDDHQVVRDGLQRMLEQEKDMKIVGHSADGEETLIQIDSLSPDVILMDIKMPGVDGIELTRQVRQKHPYCNIILLTLYDQYLTQAMEAGANGYLLKDVKRAELAQAIREVYKGQIVIGENIKSNALFADEYKPVVDIAESLPAMVEEMQIILSAPVEVLQLMKLARHIENQLRARILQMVGSWHEGTIITAILNTPTPLTEILAIFADLPEVETVGEKSFAGVVNQSLLRKAEAVSRQKQGVRKTIFVTLEKFELPKPV